MREDELETAICRAFSRLLPDLFAEGYQVVSRQAVLLGRRLDLLLQASDGRSCIIELKTGMPPMPKTRDQILDYEDCWILSYPQKQRPRLIVIGTMLPRHSEQELENFGGA